MTSGILADFDPLHPGDLGQVPDTVRKTMAVRGMLDTYYLATVILGYNMLRPKTHGPLCTFLDTCKVRRRLIQMPRSHFKTTITTIVHRIKDILNDPTLRILIVGNTGTNAQTHLGKIKQHFERNALFRWLYPDRVWEDPAGSQATEWSKIRLFIPNKAVHGEPTFDTIGARGAVVSRHYDVINADDLIADDESTSEVEMDRTIEWASGLESLFVPPIEEGLLDIPSTFWSTTDVYAFFERFFGRNQNPVATGPYSYQRGDIAVFRRGAMENGEVIFPEAVTKEFLERLQNENPERYAAQYANNPYAAGLTDFKPEWNRFYKVVDIGLNVLIAQEPGADVYEMVKTSKLYIVSMCDPHAGGGNRFKSSRAAVITTGVDVEKGRVYILECWIKRAPTNEIVDEILRQNMLWMPSVFSVESNGFQKMLKYWIEERVQRDRLPDVPVYEYVPQGDKDGERRIKGLQPLFRAGQVWMQSGFIELKEELAAYPRGLKDGLDCLAQGLEHWNVGFDSLTTAEYDEYEQALQAMRSPVTGY